MNKLKTIEYILIMLLCFIIFLLFPLGKIIRLNRIDYFAYNRDVTLNERLSVTAHIAANGKSKIDHYTILPGTVMSSEIIRTNGELNNLSFTSDNGEYITSFGGVPISKFDERDSINEDLTLLIKEREHQIDDLKCQMIILAIIALLVSILGSVLIYKFKMSKKAHIITTCALLSSITVIILYFIMIILRSR